MCWSVLLKILVAPWGQTTPSVSIAFGTGIQLRLPGTEVWAGLGGRTDQNGIECFDTLNDWISKCVVRCRPGGVNIASILVVFASEYDLSVLEF